MTTKWIPVFYLVFSFRSFQSLQPIRLVYQIQMVLIRMIVYRISYMVWWICEMLNNCVQFLFEFAKWELWTYDNNFDADSFPKLRVKVTILGISHRLECITRFRSVWTHRSQLLKELEPPNLASRLLPKILKFISHFKCHAHRSRKSFIYD